MQRAAAARAAEARRRAMVRKLVSAQARIGAADQAQKDGDIRLAARLYLRVAGERPATPFTQVGRQRLDGLRQSALGQWRDAESLLLAADNTSASDELQSGTSPRDEQIRLAFGKLEDVVDEFELVPGAGRTLKLELGKLRKQEVYASVLKEPEASRLWQIGRKHEDDGQACCAFQAYEKAVLHRPAQSAKLANERLAEMNQNEVLLKSVQTCRDLHWCHDRFAVAERVARVRPTKAVELYRQIVKRAPDDSAIHRAAVDAIAMLK